MWKKVLLCCSIGSLLVFPTESLARYRHHRHYAKPAVHLHHRHHARHQKYQEPQEVVEKVEKVEKVKEKPSIKACAPTPITQPWSVWLSTERFHEDFESHRYRVVKVRPAVFTTPKPVFDSEKPTWVGMLSSAPFTQNRNPTLEQELIALARRKYIYY